MELKVAYSSTRICKLKGVSVTSTTLSSDNRRIRLIRCSESFNLRCVAFSTMSTLLYNFGERQFLNKRISPFLTVGGGGLTASIPDASAVFIQGGGNVINPAGAVVPNPGRIKVMQSGDTFFTVNYGGGIKFLNLAGPLGFRVDVRGRTLPNFFGETTTWLEPTAGVTFSWGAR